MPLSSASGTTGLTKLHGRDCRERYRDRKRPRLTACKCDWYFRPGNGHPAINLARWSGEPVDPYQLAPARGVIKRIYKAIEDKDFDPVGENKTKTSGRTFADYIEDWWKDILEAQGRKLDTPMPIEWQVIAYDGAQAPDIDEAPEGGALGKLSLHDITAEDIEDWLADRRRLKKWVGQKSYNEYHRIIQRFLDRATKRRIIKFNPARAIERLKGMNQHRGEMRHFRFDPDIEQKLFNAVHLLNRTQQPTKNTGAKLTQEKADAIRAAVAGGALQKDLAAEYKVSPAVVCDIVAGKIWNPAARVTTTKGNEMERRLIGVFDISGQRRGEMQSVKIEHVDWKHPKKLVDEATGRRFNGYEIALPPAMTKGGKFKGETEYLYAATLRASEMLEKRHFQLRANPQHQQFIWGTDSGRQVKDFRKSWHALFSLVEETQNWGRAQRLTWHTTRAEFLSRIGDNTENTTWDLKEAGRHANIRTSERYQRQASERRWEVAFRLNKRT